MKFHEILAKTDWDINKKKKKKMQFWIKPPFFYDILQETHFFHDRASNWNTYREKKGTWWNFK